MHNSATKTVLLRKASVFARSKAKSWCRSWRPSGPIPGGGLRVKFDFPGILYVYSAASGDLLVESDPGCEYLTADRSAALMASARKFADSHGITFEWHWRPDPGDWKTAYTVRFDFPGVLSVFCAASGELLVKSKPGRPEAVSE